MLTKNDFDPHAGTAFQVRLDPAESVELVLAEVGELVDPAGREEEIRRHPFSLVFRGAHRFVLPQRTYVLEHPVMGTLEIFLVPIGPNNQGMGYEAVFN
jgi:hypothetical protein